MDFLGPGRFLLEEGVPNARGRVLGGSRAINAGFYSRADPDLYKNSGLNGDLRVVNHSYEWVEKAIVFQPDLKNWQSAVRDGLIEPGVDPYNGFTFNHYVGTKIGGTTFDKMGNRHSAADLLQYAKPLNIKVAVHAIVERILVASSSSSALSASKQSAIGVVYRDRTGAYHHAMVRDKGEVLLSAGALGTPQLLLLSGIGPRPYLSSWGIPVVHHYHYVGQDLYENPRNGISIVPPMPLEHSLIQVVGITNSGAYLEAASNVIPFSSPACGNEWIRRGLFLEAAQCTIWHYHDGCVTGKVVDRNFRVSGVGALRVVDGSILSVSPGTNPQATALMMGR
ncbi:hypothetical protein OROHE_027355 [Orobanche hederae]